MSELPAINWRAFAPSYMRPKAVTTQAYLPFVTYIVAESEAESYRSEGHGVEVCPDSVQGNVSRVRNWILDQAFGEWNLDGVVQIDDDVSGILRWYHGKHQKFDADDVQAFAERAFILAGDGGTALWGLNPTPSSKWAYCEHTPFCFTKYIPSPFFGVLKTDIRFDERLSLKEDFDFTLQVVNRHRRALRFNGYGCVSDQHGKAGGCATYRTVEREREQLSLLQNTWGRDIVKTDTRASRRARAVQDLNPRLSIPIPGA